MRWAVPERPRHCRLPKREAPGRRGDSPNHRGFDPYSFDGRCVSSALGWFSPGLQECDKCTLCEHSSSTSHFIFLWLSPLVRHSVRLGHGDCRAGSKGMVCPGRLSAPFAKPGFFVSTLDPTIALACPSEEACLGGANSGNASGNASCHPGYAGSLCARCTEGSYLIYHQCKPCGIPALIWSFSVVSPIVAIIGVSLDSS